MGLALAKATSEFTHFQSKGPQSEMAVPLPPGGAMEIVFSFDTTGSMSSYLDEVRRSVTEITERLFADIPALRMSIFAHGDYCDAATSYVTKHTELTKDVKSLCEFVKTVGATGGGDTPECYELVLRQVSFLRECQIGFFKRLFKVQDCKLTSVNFTIALN